MEIDLFRPEDYEPLSDMTKNSFQLNSFNVDAHLPRLLKGELFFETLAKKAFRENSSSCLVAREKNKPLGYIIFGFDTKLSEFFSLSTASIMLFCVDMEAQGKGVGKALLNKALFVLRSKGVRLITVGTDSNNLAALNLYQTAGFRTRMIWGTYRYYPKFKIEKGTSKASVQPYGGEKGIDKLIRFSERPVAFFRENKIDKRGLVRLRQDIYANITDRIKSGRCGSIIAKMPGAFYDKLVGLITYEEEKVVQEFFNSGEKSKKIYRVNDLVVHDRHRNMGIGTHLVSEFISNIQDCHFVEGWVAMENWALINILTKCRFRLSHMATVLHHFE